MSIFITYPGVIQPTSVRATEVNGPFPSQAVLQFLPQLVSPSYSGTLYFGVDAQSVTWLNARIDKSSLQITTNGHIASCVVHDRRDWWKNTVVSGAYNDPGGVQKNVPELATILLDAMGEVNYDISALSGIANIVNLYPEVNWFCANPSLELERLLNEYGCTLSLDYSTNRTVVRRIGTGSAIPSDYVQSVDFGVDHGDVPDTVRVCFDETRYEAKLKLVPYMFDTAENDNELLPLDDVSFAPASPEYWSETTPHQDPILPSGTAEENALASRYLWRLYKIESMADGTLNVPGGPTLSGISQIILRDMKAYDTFPATVEGSYFPLDQDVEANTNTDDGTIYIHGFVIDAERQLVWFSEPVYKYTESGGYEAADIYLHTSFLIKDETTSQLLHYYYDYTALTGTGVFPVPRRDQRLKVVALYDPSNPYTLEDPAYSDNSDALDTIAVDNVNAILPRFASYSSIMVKYIGIRNVQTDGVNKQVIHVVDMDKGANSWVAQNTEPDIGSLRSYEMIRLAHQKQRLHRNDEQMLQMSERSRQLQKDKGRVR